MKNLFFNKWFMFGVVNLVFFGTLISDGLGACLWFAYFILWIIYGDKKF